MAGIDKTYITSYDDYKKVIDWCKGKSFKLSNGQVIYPSNFIYYPDITKEEWDENEKMFKQEYPDGQYDKILWNTPIYFDIWLIRNCPFDFIQNRLKEQYGGGWSKTAFTDHNESLYEQIKNGTNSVVIFDQIENDVDKDFINNVIRNLIGETKGYVQLIIVTHDPIVAVNADPNNYIECKKVGDKFEYRSFVAESSERDELNTIACTVDGSKAVIKGRYEIYEGENVYGNNNK